MHLLNITNLQAFGILMGMIAFVWLFIRLVPSNYETPEERFRKAQITAYDRQIPKYFLIGTGALVIGGLHTVLKSIPGFWQWLWQAGYGGHLFRDAANSHIVIMGGGTILLIGITWYLLPRFVNRPLYSNTLANISLWLLITGISCSYLSWFILGLVEGNMVVHGWEYAAAKEYLNLWHRLPTGLSSGIMGIGFWIYVINLYATVGLAKRVVHKPLNYLTKFLVITATAYLIGTVQGIFQVVGSNAYWIDLAGKYGEYIDPISHVHTNLLLGMMVTLGVLLAYFAPRMNGKPVSERTANRLFWTFVPAAAAFYLTFLTLGLSLGRLRIGYGGLDLGWLALLLQEHTSLVLGVVGFGMLVGFWTYFVLLWKTFGLSNLLGEIKEPTPKAFWIVSSFLLVIGTFQGMLQIIPATGKFLTLSQEIPNIHAQLNMTGGVVLALIGIVQILIPELMGTRMEPRLMRRGLYGITTGILAYYLTTVATGLARWTYLNQGLSDAESTARLGWVSPTFLLLTALPLCYGFLSFGRALWRVSERYWARWVTALRSLPERVDGMAPQITAHYPKRYFIAIEAIFGIFGFPGIGWIFSGRAFVGTILAVVSPIILWVFIPIVLSVYQIYDQWIFGPSPMMAYLGISTTLSLIALWQTLENRVERMSRR